jgi:hypothetical protein
MFGFMKKLLGGSGIVGSIERIASEAIQTDMETAEAKALFIKTLDPNGMMRRELSRFACIAYAFYLVVMSALLMVTAFGFGDIEGAKVASAAMTDLFLPITTAWGGIVSASFGTNISNNWKEVKASEKDR